MNFRLEKSTSSSTKTLTKFFVYDDKNAIVGTINVKPSEENDLRAHWKDVSPSSPKTAAAKQDPMVSAMVAAVRKQGPRVNRAAVLRGC
jgi:hypothetical protein